jgi:hypothetical protein
MKTETKHIILKFFNSILKRDIFILSFITIFGYYTQLAVLLSPLIVLFLIRIYIGLFIHIGRKNIIVLYNKDKKNFKHVFHDLNNKHSLLFRKIMDFINASFFSISAPTEGIYLLFILSVFLTFVLLNSIITIIFSLFIAYMIYYYFIYENEKKLVNYPNINTFIYSIDKKNESNILEYQNNLSKNNINNKSLSFFEIYEELLFIYNKSNMYINNSIKIILHTNRK